MNRSPIFQLLAFLIGLILLTGIQQSVMAQSQVFETRRTAYNDTALAHVNSHSICIQAYEGEPVDQLTLNDIVSVINTDPVIDFSIVKLIRVLFLTNGQHDSLLLPALNFV